MHTHRRTHARLTRRLPLLAAAAAVPRVYHGGGVRRTIILLYFTHIPYELDRSKRDDSGRKINQNKYLYWQHNTRSVLLLQYLDGMTYRCCNLDGDDFNDGDDRALVLYNDTLTLHYIGVKNE